MEPIGTIEDPHGIVCDFVRAAVDAGGDGMSVEVTAVDRPDVDRTRTEELAARLGVSELRWRSYFP